MAADFPDNPSVNDTFTVGDRSWIWNGTTWDAAVEEVLSADAPITFNSSTRTVGLDQTGVQDGRNYIINGAFDIWQRGDGPFDTSQDYTADRFKINLPGLASGQVTKQNFTADELNVIGFGDAESYLEFDVTTGDNFLYLEHSVEDVRTLANQTVTLSFWAKGTPPGGNGLSVGYFMNFGSGGSSNVSNSNGIQSGGINLTSQWQRFTFTYTTESLAGKTIGPGSYYAIRIGQSGANTSSDAWRLDLWGVQLEAGSIATPFKRNANSIQGELAACQRYYYRTGTNTDSFRMFSSIYANTETNVRGYLQFPVTMRSSPTFNATGNFQVMLPGVAETVTSISGFRASTDSLEIEIDITNTVTRGEAGVLRASNDTTAFLELDAEL